MALGPPSIPPSPGPLPDIPETSPISDEEISFNAAASATIAEYTDTVGVGSLALRGAITGHFRFRDAHDHGEEITFHVNNGPDIEVITGVLNYGTPDTLSIGTVLASSNGGNKVFWKSGTRPIIRELITALDTTSPPDILHLWTPHIFINRKPTALEMLTVIGFAYDAMLPINLTGSVAGNVTAGTGLSTFGLFKNFSDIGSVSFGAGAAVGTFVFPNEVSFESGDTFSLQLTSAVDTTLSHIWFTFLGSLL